ncbi:hypothetical protein AaE_005183 [Aphanomyces astaci]|uniref:Uncharacterized protein n=1 Tax=Aphanomyces astaci TaxID=112090 RepID=A0A6A5A354_APHAT|nr:hypothetical protein AaE_005183 [Aphanomyces astaci]
MPTTHDGGGGPSLWPELTWEDIDADVHLLTKSSTSRVAEPLASHVELIVADTPSNRLELIAQNIFHVHQSLGEAIQRVQGESALVRVIQSFLTQQGIHVDGDGKAEQWLREHALEWSFFEKDDGGRDELLQCIRDDIHSATSKAEFLQYFDAALHPSVWFPVHNRLHREATPSSTVLGNLPLISDAEAFQDAKDIKRDQLRINGVLFPGIVGYDALIKALVDEIHRVAVAFRPSYHAFASTYEEMAKRILHSINRTESGGGSYEVLTSLVTPPRPHATSLVLLRPNSKAATPLHIHIEMGPYEDHEGTWCFGLRTVVSAETSYVICDSDDPTTEWLAVQAKYENRLAFSIGMSPFTSETRGAREDGGQVQLLRCF